MSEVAELGPWAPDKNCSSTPARRLLCQPLVMTEVLAATTEPRAGSLDEGAHGAEQTRKARSLVFGEFRLDLDDFTLMRNGRTVPIEPLAFDVLVTLVTRSPAIVSTKEILERHWKRTTVCRGALWQCVWRIRTILGDSVTVPRFIENVPGRGYRFIGAVRTGDDR